MEKWITVPRHPDFEVSDLGRIRSKRTGRVRSCPFYGRYRKATLDGERIFVHRTVLEAFTGLDPDRPNALHEDGDRNNNHLSNLYWGTQADNYEDARRAGTNPQGEKHGQAKLTKEAESEIRNTPKTRGSGRALARRFGISEQRVCDIRNGRGWEV